MTRDSCLPPKPAYIASRYTFYLLKYPLAFKYFRPTEAWFFPKSAPVKLICFSAWGNQSSERLRKLPRIIKSLRGRGRHTPRESNLSVCTFNHYPFDPCLGKCFVYKRKINHSLAATISKSCMCPNAIL